MSVNTPIYTIGCDPELFLFDQKAEKMRSAHTVIPGSKDSPFEVLNGAIQVDGVAAEFNIAPAVTAEQFTGNIRDVLTELTDRIYAKNPNLVLLVQPTATFEKGYFRKLPAYVRALGCQPDFNVYANGQANPPPETGEPFRTGAGHIHVGWTVGQIETDGAHLYDCHQMVKQLDSVLYPFSLLWDNDERRRSLYGKIGSYRPKHYGVEYRPLSNSWVADPDLHVWIFNATKHSAEALDADQPYFHDHYTDMILKEIRDGEQPARTRLLEYHDYMVEEYMVPSLPETYTRTHQ